MKKILLLSLDAALLSVLRLARCTEEQRRKWAEPLRSIIIEVGTIEDEEEDAK